MNLLKTIKSALLYSAISFVSHTQITHASPNFDRNLKTPQLSEITPILKQFRTHILHSNATSQNSSCHYISDKHTLCIQTHNPQVHPESIANRYKEVIKTLQDSIDIPENAQSTSGFDYLIIQNSQQNLEKLMKQLQIPSFWGYFEEDLLENGHNAIFSFTKYNQGYQSPWMYNNVSHELAHAAFSAVIQKNKPAKTILRQVNINPKVILEGFAEFIKFANQNNSPIQIPGLPKSYIEQSFQYPQISNPPFTQETKIYSLQELLEIKPLDNNHEYYYGKIFFSFLHQNYRNLYKLLLNSLKQNSLKGLEHFKRQLFTEQKNTQFQNYQRLYIYTHNKMHPLILKHTKNLY